MTKMITSYLDDSLNDVNIPQIVDMSTLEQQPSDRIHTQLSLVASAIFKHYKKKLTYDKLRESLEAAFNDKIPEYKADLDEYLRIRNKHGNKYDTLYINPSRKMAKEKEEYGDLKGKFLATPRLRVVEDLDISRLTGRLVIDLSLGPPYTFGFELLLDCPENPKHFRPMIGLPRES